MEQIIRIGLVEDQLLFRQGVKSIIESWEKMSVIFESEDGFSVKEKLEKLPQVPDVMLVDLSLPDNGDEKFNGLDLTKELKKYYPEIKVLILSVNNDEFFISQLIENGANGYLSKNCPPQEIYDAIVAMYSKGSYINAETLRVIQSRLSGKLSPSTDDLTLTKRELEVLKLVCQQLTAEEIGQKLFISTKTVNGHRNNLLQKTNSRNATGLVLYAIKNRLVELV